MKKTKRLHEMTEEERIKHSDEHAVQEAERLRLEACVKKKKQKKPGVCPICGLPPDLCVCSEFTTKDEDK